MPIIKSAKKRVRVAKKATAENLRTKRVLRAAQKDVRIASTGTNKKTLIEAHRKNQSALDVAGKKGLMHKHKVARKQRQLSAQVKAASIKQTPTTPKKATIAKKAPVKK